MAAESEGRTDMRYIIVELHHHEYWGISVFSGGDRNCSVSRRRSYGYVHLRTDFQREIGVRSRFSAPGPIGYQYPSPLYAAG